MRRRDFNQGAAVAALLGLTGCGGGGGGGSGSTGGAAAGGGSSGGGAPAAGAVGAADDLAPAAVSSLLGTNLAGMEAAFGVRRSPETRPNVDFTVPRAAEIAWLARDGFGRNRLPFMWELLQPMLVDTAANAQARALIGEPGAFDESYARFIDGVLDAHAAAGTRCILDCHNYCRYTDFRFRADGSVAGLTAAPSAEAHAYTSDPSQVFTRIFATAPGATLQPAAFADFWRRAAQRWSAHPGFGGYGLMNEPHDLPEPGQVVESQDFRDDKTIWPVFARAGIAAIRAVDPAGTIYLAGNFWGGAMNIGPEQNPEWPLPGANIVYEVHSYLDAFNNGAGFDWDLEQQKDFVAGFGPGKTTVDTGRARMQIATDWARAHGTRVALTETGMPIDDVRWQDAFGRLMAHTAGAGWETQSWMGGSHWPARNHAINHVPGWHQDRTVPPLVAGLMQAAVGIDRAALFDDVAGAAAPGTAVTITVYARGNLARPVTLGIRVEGAGTASKQAVVIPAGPNGQDSFTFTPSGAGAATLTYVASDPPGRQVPPARRIVSFADPVAAAASQPADAALAILARFAACKWDLADGFTDFVLGHPAQDGEAVRALADSGFGSSPGNAMEMLNWMNQDAPGMGPLRPPVMRTSGRPHADLTAEGTIGFWCHKPVPGGTLPNPRNRVPYGLGDPHFAIAVVRLPAAAAAGTVFQATTVQQSWHTALAVNAGRAQARWTDVNGQSVVLEGPALAPGALAVLTLVSAPGRQQLRVNGVAAGSAAAGLAPGPFGDLLIGWGDPPAGAGTAFRGHVFAVATGRGEPGPAELAVLERYLLG